MVMSVLSLVALLAAAAADLESGPPQSPVLPSQAASPAVTTADSQWRSPADHRSAGGLPEDDQFPATPTASPTAAETSRLRDQPSAATPQRSTTDGQSSGTGRQNWTSTGEKRTPGHRQPDQEVKVYDTLERLALSEQNDDRSGYHGPSPTATLPTTSKPADDTMRDLSLAKSEDMEKDSDRLYQNFIETINDSEGLSPWETVVEASQYRKETDDTAAKIENEPIMSVYDYRWASSYIQPKINSLPARNDSSDKKDDTKEVTNNEERLPDTSKLEEASSSNKQTSNEGRNEESITKNSTAFPETKYDGGKVDSSQIIFNDTTRLSSELTQPENKTETRTTIPEDKYDTQSIDSSQVTSDSTTQLLSELSQELANEYLILDTDDSHRNISAGTNYSHFSDKLHEAPAPNSEYFERTEQTPLSDNAKGDISTNNSTQKGSSDSDQAIPQDFQGDITAYEEKTETPVLQAQDKETYSQPNEDAKDIQQEKDSFNLLNNQYAEDEERYIIYNNDYHKQFSRTDFKWSSPIEEEAAPGPSKTAVSESADSNTTDSEFGKDVQSSRQETIDIEEDHGNVDTKQRDDADLPSSTLSISEQEAGIQVYITFTQAQVQSSQSPQPDVQSQTASPGSGETSTKRNDIMSKIKMHKDIDGVESYVIPSLDFEESGSTELSHESGGVQDGSVVTTPPMSVVKDEDDAAQMQSDSSFPKSTSQRERHRGRGYDVVNPYRHWDIDSEEQERAMKSQRLPNANPDAAPPRVHDQGSPQAATNTTSRSYLLLLAGNSTIVKLRQKDFAKYLKLNLAARLSLEYDDVKVNRVVLAPPRLLVNVSVVTPPAVTTAERVITADDDTTAAEVNVVKEEAPLHKLAKMNATLLELSGEEYHIVRLLPLHQSHQLPPADNESYLLADGEPEEAASGDPEYREEQRSWSSSLSGGRPDVSYRHDDIEVIIYTAVGSACAIAVVATAFVSASRYLRVTGFQWPWRSPRTFSKTPWILPNHYHHGGAGRNSPPHYRMDEDGLHPTVIYSGAFAAAHGSNPSGCGSTGPSSWADDYQPPLPERPGAAGPGAVPMFGTAGDPLATSALYSDVVQSSPRSKLHLFSCRPGSLLIPIAPPQSPLKMPRPLPPLKGKLVGGLDNPNYEK